MDQPDLNETTRLQALYSRRVAARGDGEGRSCVTPEAILALVRQEGAEAERLTTLEHVMSCAACHREYEWLRAVNEAGLEADAGAAAGSRRSWWRNGRLALAASLLVAVGATVVVSRVMRPGSESERGNSSDITLIAPDANAETGALVTFAWRALAGASRYVLEIQRPDGSVALADTTADTTITVNDPGRLVPSTTYRWWVREVTDGLEPRSSPLRNLRLTGR